MLFVGCWFLLVVWCTLLTAVALVVVVCPLAGAAFLFVSVACCSLFGLG